MSKVTTESGSEDGDAQRLTLLFHAYQPRIQQFARRRVGADAAQEIVAETFLVAWRRLHDIPDPPLPWLYRVASLEIANFHRRQVKSLEVERAVRQSLDPGATRRDASENFDRTEFDRTESEAIARAFESLEPREHEILRLATWEGLSSAEGAIVLGCSISAYRVRLHRARSRLTKKSGLRSRGWSEPRRRDESTQPQRQPTAGTGLRPREGIEEVG